MKVHHYRKTALGCTLQMHNIPEEWHGLSDTQSQETRAIKIILQTTNVCLYLRFWLWPIKLWCWFIVCLNRRIKSRQCNCKPALRADCSLIWFLKGMFCNETFAARPEAIIPPIHLNGHKIKPGFYVRMACHWPFETIWGKSRWAIRTCGPCCWTLFIWLVTVVSNGLLVNRGGVEFFIFFDKDTAVQNGCN